MLASGPILGIVVGWATRGSVARLAEIRIRWWMLLPIGVTIRLLAAQTGTLAPLLYGLAFTAIVAVTVVNLRVPGMPLIAIGAALNLLVVGLNAGMPVDAAALQVAGGSMPSDRLHVPLTEGTVLAVLADRIPVAPFRAVYSVGDVALTAGGFWVPFAAMRRR